MARVLVLIFALLSLTACNLEREHSPIPMTITPILPTANPFVTYRWDAVGIAFDYPEEWYMDVLENQITLTTFPPHERPAMAAWTPETLEIALLYRPDAPADLAEWVAHEREQYFQLAEIHDTTALTLANRLPALRLDVVSASGHLVSNVYTHINGRGLVINYTGSESLAIGLIHSIRLL